MKRLLLLALTVTLLRAAASHPITAAAIVDAVFISLFTDHDDEHLARDLSNVTLTEQLSPHVVTYFQGQGIGPRSLAALVRLRDRSAALPPPALAPLSIQPIPADSARKEMLDRVRTYAQSYARDLPNFVCDKVTHRFTNVSGSLLGGTQHFAKQLHESDHFTLNLRFVKGVEQISSSATSHNDRAKLMAKKGASFSTGEFGIDMLNVFGPGIAPVTAWHHWQTINGKRVAVFRYYVSLAQSRYELTSCCNVNENGVAGAPLRARVPMSGLVFIDPGTGRVFRLALKAAALPDGFPIRESATVIDYSSLTIGATPYLLPKEATIFVRSELPDGKRSTQRNLNRITFRDYRKFEAESVLSFPR